MDHDDDYTRDMPLTNEEILALMRKRRMAEVIRLVREEKRKALRQEVDNHQESE